MGKREEIDFDLKTVVPKTQTSNSTFIWLFVGNWKEEQCETKLGVHLYSKEPEGNKAKRILALFSSCQVKKKGKERDREKCYSLHSFLLREEQ